MISRNLESCVQLAKAQHGQNEPASTIRSNDNYKSWRNNGYNLTWFEHESNCPSNDSLTWYERGSHCQNSYTEGFPDKN